MISLRRADLAQNPTPLRIAPRLSFLFAHTYTIQVVTDTTDRQIVPIGYRYELIDTNESELLAYHWHPYGQSPVIVPHLHVSNRHPDFDLSKIHLPTAVVSPNAVLRCLITEFGVEPLRPDWDDILGDA